MDDRQFVRVLELLNCSWKGYRKVRKGVQRRLVRHMQELGCRSIDGYLDRLRSDPEVRAECERRMSVSISRFFRDIRFWQVLGQKVLPELAGQDRARVAVWFAGCAGGEEVYSFRILWEELRASYREAPAAELTATDMNQQFLERARTGIYPRGALRDLSGSRREKWFEGRGQDQLAVKPELKSGIVWQVHNVLSEPPPEKSFNMIFIRNNLLTYYPSERIRRPLGRIIEALSRGGFLIIGSTESLPSWAESRMSPYARCIFRKSS